MPQKPKKTAGKALHNPFKALTRAETLAEKTEKALQTYPFADISLHLNLKINPRAKNMALRVDIKGRKVNLVLPKRASMRSAYKFALDHKYWIQKKIAELPQSIPFAHGTMLSILGEDVEVIVTYNSTLKRTSIKLKDNQLLISTNKEDPSLRIKRFIINYAKERLSALAHEKAELVGKDIHSITLKDTSSRWGSCSHDGKLCFSWRLIFAPYTAFDYVVAHEVAHLTHMNHSPAFWNHCSDICDDYSHGKTWMKRHSGELVRYG